MTTILYVIIALWLAKAAVETCIGILQVVAGLACSVLSLTLLGLASLIEILSRLWETAFCE